MGINNSRPKKHLSPSEITAITSNNPSLQTFYNQYKNANGNLQEKDLLNLFQNSLHPKIIKYLYCLCCHQKNKFNFEDFKYLYSLFYTTDYEAKINFIVDIIFLNNSQLTHERYRRKLKIIFGDCQAIYYKLSSDDFISNMSNQSKIFKGNFYKNIENSHKSFIHNFFFLEQEEKSEMKEEKLLLSICDCITKRALKPSETVITNQSVSKIFTFRNTTKWNQNSRRWREITMACFQLTTLNQY
jgi:hypothetical protein